MEKYIVQNKETGYRAIAYDTGDRIAVAFSSDQEPYLTVLQFYSDTDEAVLMLNKYCQVETNLQIKSEVDRQIQDLEIKGDYNENLF